MSSKTILVIDDDLPLLQVIRDNLSYIPDLEIITCESSAAGLEAIAYRQVNTIITDINLPEMNGLELLEKVRDLDHKIPVILITGFSDAARMRTAIQLGAFDFLRKPFAMTELLITVKQALEKNELLIENEAYHKNLEQLVQQRTLELFAAKSKLEKHYLNTMHAMVNAIEANDIYTRGHSERVTAISLLLGKMAGVTSSELSQLRIGTILHDLGKIGIYKPIWDKPDQLSDDEYDQMKQHPLIGARIIDPIGLPKAVHEIILQHHERLDGSGYPLGLKGETISPLARIAAVADAYDAMTSKRRYRKNIAPLAACEEIHKHLNTQFDHSIGKMLCDNLKQITSVLTEPTALRVQLQEEF
jgi:putative nucleotidyltransferase with HDIG domain